jgi:hypothetical protein
VALLFGDYFFGHAKKKLLAQEGEIKAKTHSKNQLCPYLNDITSKPYPTPTHKSIPPRQLWIPLTSNS